jgi:eukaryotic-like serine/threonine-protein kinase
MRRCYHSSEVSLAEEDAYAVAAEEQRPSSTLLAGRYILGAPFASGGMGSVHLGRIVGSSGFSRVVAIKRLFPGFAGEPSFRQNFLDEAHFASRIRHPNVVPILDVVEDERDLYVVMEYVHGLSLAGVLDRTPAFPVPVDIAVAVVGAVLLGLHAAHEARDEEGAPLGIVHRDVSPQNLLMGADGVPRLIDFGIAKAATRAQVTEPGIVKGKAGYMAPEQLLGEPIARQADVFAASVVLWELLTGRPLFPYEVGERIGHLGERAPPPSQLRAEVDPALDAVVLRALERNPAQRFPTAEAMMIELQRDRPTPSAAAVARWLAEAAGDDLELSEERVRLFEQSAPPRSPPPPRSDSPLSSAMTLEQESFRAPVERKRARGWLVVVAVALAGLGVLAFELAPGRSAAPVPQPAQSVVIEPPPPPSVPSVLVVLPPADPPAPAPTGATRATGVGLSRPAPGHRSARSKCDPPYTVDASGFKHYDPRCF